MAPTSTSVRVVFNNFPAIQAGLRSKAGMVVRKAALDIEARAKTKAPVDTGALRNSIAAQKHPSKPFSWVVIVGVEYGIYQEFGTVHHGAQPFLFPAAHEVEPQFLAALNSLVGP